MGGGAEGSYGMLRIHRGGEGKYGGFKIHILTCNNLTFEIKRFFTRETAFMSLYETNLFPPRQGDEGINA